MGIPKLLALLLVPAYVVLIALLDTRQTRAVFESPLLILVLNTLFLGILFLVVAYIAGRVYLKTGSSSVLLTGCGMLTFGLCAIPAGWLTGMSGCPNITVTMHNTGALVGAFFLALGSILNLAGRKSPDQRGTGKQKVTAAYGCVCIFVVIFTFATVKDLVPSFFIQDVGPTVLRQAVLATAVILFVLSSAFFMHTYAQWKSDFLYWYSFGLALIAIGLCALFLEHAVGSPIGWLGRSAQYLGGVFSLVAVVIAWKSARSKGLPFETVIASFVADAEANYRNLVETARDAIISFDQEGRIISWNSAAEMMFGHTKGDAIGSPFLELVHFSVLEEKIRRVAAQTKKSFSARAIEVEGKRRDGSLFPVEVSVSVREMPTGLVSTCIVRDITERKRAEETLRKTEQMLESILATSPVGIVLTQDRRIKWANAAWVEMFGFASEHEYVDQPSSIMHPSQENYEPFREALYDNLKPGKASDVDAKLARKDGALFDAHIRVKLLEPSDPSKGAISAISDISERKRAELALQASETRYRRLFESAKDGILILDADTAQIVDANPFLAHLLRYSREEMLEKKLWEIGLWRDIAQCKVVFLELQSNEYVRYEDLPLETEAGKIVNVEFVSNVYRVDGDKVIQCNIRDITDRKRASEALAASEGKYRSLFEASIDAIFITERDGTLIDANPAFFDLFGYQREELIGESILKTYVDPADRRAYTNEIKRRGSVRDYPLRFRKKDGTEMDCALTGTVRRADDGTLLGYRGIIRDLTQQKNLQKQVLQAQKMEAIGTLAGGIAHDFNNLLAVVMGFSELLLAKKEQDHPEYADLQKILHAAKNGAELVQRLLMFSRKSEPKPVSMNLNKQIVEVDKLLRRTIPRMIDIHLDLSADLPEINADRFQVEQVLINLAVNARDAMPDSGKLTVMTQTVTLDEEYCRLHVEATPGEHVLLSVSDTGHGMDKETVQHIFEPFFTTKEMGSGTGLGLAVVYGIVNQHNGHITCYSEVGHGTTFKVYLPAIQGEVETDVETTAIMPAFGTETVLLVDDEDLVSDLGARILTTHGYTVLKASNGREALDLFKKERPQISLVILDLIMPEMGGTECLKKLIKIDPQVKVLVASGYSVDASGKEAIQVGAKGFVTKPFRVNEILRDVRRVLDEG
jgi:PAS domain S-box-containing protein